MAWDRDNAVNSAEWRFPSLGVVEGSSIGNDGGVGGG